MPRLAPLCATSLQLHFTAFAVTSADVTCQFVTTRLPLLRRFSCTRTARQKTEIDDYRYHMPRLYIDTLRARRVYETMPPLFSDV